MNNKKGQGLSMNVIIIAALALIVMVVLTVVFMGKMGDNRRSIDQCENNGGVCVDKGSCNGAYERTISAVCFGTDSKPDINKECCVRV